MKNSDPNNLTGYSRKSFGYVYIILGFVSLSAVAAAFFAANSNLGFNVKILVFLGIVLSYPALFFAVYLWQLRKTEIVEREMSKNLFNSEVEGKLAALEEASEFFGASLKSVDMFRLVVNRVNELMPFAACALFLANEDNTSLKIVLADGENSQSLKNLEIESHRGLAGKAFISGKAQADEKLILDKNIHADAVEFFDSAAAVPLTRGAADDVFGVLTLYGDAGRKFNQNSLPLLKSIGERVAPLFLSSLAFERNVANALTDSLTNLPNERAFYLVLENQIAESQRFRIERPLTILTVDIKNFGDLNEKFGHAAGDRILTFVADSIKLQLRQMDFLARSAGDEFLVVLPTAANETAAEIVERLEKSFASKPFEVSRREKIYLQLNFGLATFLRDGETAGQLLQAAHLRKQQAKTPGKSSILWFPQQYVN